MFKWNWSYRGEFDAHGRRTDAWWPAPVFWWAGGGPRPGARGTRSDCRRGGGHYRHRNFQPATVVIHAGICTANPAVCARVLGRQALHGYCRDHVGARADHRRHRRWRDRGSAQLERTAVANGVTDLKLLSAASQRGRRRMRGGALVAIGQQSVIMATCWRCMRNRPAASVVTFSVLAAARRTRTGNLDARYPAGPEPMSLSCRMLINAAGAHGGARSTPAPREKIPQAYFAKGNYSCGARVHADVRPVRPNQYPSLDLAEG